MEVVMGKVEEAVRSEITRLARKELRATVGPLLREVRDLKRTVGRLATVVAKLDRDAAQRSERQAGRKGWLEVAADEVRTARISARAIKNLRKKLGISQEKLALLAEVSPGGVAAWEQGRARPRGKNKAILVALRKLGRRDVKRILAESGVSDEGRAKKRRRKESPC
jgi:DNA-binding transcriptional regulator YiaG